MTPKTKLKNFLIFLSFLFLSFQPLTDPDLGWHLRNGQQILQNQSIQYTDTYSFSLPNHPYINHSWLHDLTLIAFFNTFNLWGVNLLYSVIIATSLFLLLKASLSKPTSLSIAVIILAIPLTLEIIGLRAHLISFLGLTLIYFLLHTQPSKQTSSHFSLWLKQTKLIFIPLIFLLWANLHAGFIIGLSYLLLFIVSETLFASPPKNTTKNYLYLFLVSSAATLINPYTYKIYTLITTMLTNTTSLAQNTDWLPLLSPHLPQSTIPLRAGFLLITSIIIFTLKKYKSQRAILTIFLFLSLRSIRFLLPTIVFLIPLLIKLTAQLTHNQKTSTIKYSPLIALAIIVYPTFSNLQKTHCANTSPQCYAQLGNFPYLALTKLQPISSHLHIFNHYTWGGYLDWQLPSHKVFIDGRMDNFIVDNKSFLDEFAHIQQLKPNWQSKLASYQPDTILIPTNWQLTQQLQQDPSWRLFHQDPLATVFFKSPPKSE